MKIVLPNLKCIDYTNELTTSAALLSEITDLVASNLIKNQQFTNIFNYYLVGEDSELIVKFDSKHRQVYVVDQELYKDIKVEKMSCVGTFDMKGFLRAEIEKTSTSKKREVKQTAKDQSKQYNQTNNIADQQLSLAEQQLQYFTGQQFTDPTMAYYQQYQQQFGGYSMVPGYPQGIAGFDQSSFIQQPEQDTLTDQ